MREILLVANALSDESRLRMVLGLRQGELCVCQLAELVGLAQSTVSKHMTILRTAGLVESRRDGRWIYYRRADVTLSSVVREALIWIDKSSAKNALARADAKRVKAMIQSGLCAFPDKGLTESSVRERAEA